MRGTRVLKDILQMHVLGRSVQSQFRLGEGKRGSACCVPAERSRVAYSGVGTEEDLSGRWDC